MSRCLISIMTLQSAMLVCDPAMRLVTGYAMFSGTMHRFGCKHFLGMATQAIFVNRLYPVVRFMALITIQPRHWYFIRKRSPRRFPMAGKASFPVRDKNSLSFRRKRMTGHARDFLHADSMDFPVVMTPQTSLLIWTECMNTTGMAVHADHLLDNYMPCMSGRLIY